MDSLTHTVIGVCLGELIVGRQLGRKGMLLGALAGNIPDLDVVSQFWTGPAESFLAHRGFTHSILFVLLFSVFSAFVFKKLFVNKSVSWKRWLALSVSGLGVHVFLDAFTSYGTGWFEPFDHSRVSFNSLYIIDPLFSIPFLIGTVALLVLSRHSGKRTQWAAICLAAGSIYFAATIVNKFHINKVIEENIYAQKILCEDYMATPTPLNNFLWYIIVRDKIGYHIGYYSVFEEDGLISFDRISRGDSLLSHACESKELSDFLRFTNGYYCIRSQNDSLVVSDMRFGQQEGWRRRNAPFVLNFYIKGEQTSCNNLQEGRFKFFSAGSFSALFSRIRTRDIVR